jgi:hypothetical protein
MIEKRENGQVLIVSGNIHLMLNGNEATEQELQLIAAMNPDNADEVIADEIKMRSIHKKIIAKKQFDLIEEMVAFDPNGWFVAYCTQVGIKI